MKASKPVTGAKLPLSLSEEEHAIFKDAAARCGIPLSTWLKAAGLYCADYIMRTGTMPVRHSAQRIEADAMVALPAQDDKPKRKAQ